MLKVGSSLSEWLEIILEVLGSILFNFFINGLLLSIKEIDICNFADDTTPYACGKDLDTISNKLELEQTQRCNGLKIMN